MSAALLSFLPVISSVIGAGGQYLEAKKQAEFATYNARVAEKQAEAVRQSADFAISRIQMRKRKFMATQHVGYAKSGVRFEGSPIEVMADTALNFELDKHAEDYNATMQIMALQSEAKLSRMQAAQYNKEAVFKPAMTLLTSGANAFMNYGFSKAGASGGSGGGPVDTNGGRGTAIAISGNRWGVRK